ncbi:Arabidopsis NAC domain containing protein 87 [Hibiscus trionum]|uniref:Arabidopsis NAC domain containing protein 87 n=1 Tax=Hibiscus trionum TaxID=183268 RepID=A0A9W7HLA1_HIBTR|nr:Arabidopsis NAC domain containing protein 87 [Hibiscus trionum]
MPDIPPGLVFDPSGVEILSFYLPMLIANGGNVVAGLGQYSKLIMVSNVYSCEPWFFFRDDEPDAFGRGEQRFVFSCREKIARKNSNGKRPRREVHGTEGGGFWKSSTGEKPVADEHGRVLGFFNMLNFYEYHGHNNDYKKKNRKGELKKTSWIMYEYRLNGERFQEWVICKIKKTCRKKREAAGEATEDDDGGLVREIEELASSPDED